MTSLISFSLARQVAEDVYGDAIGRRIPDGWELDTTFNNDPVQGIVGVPGTIPGELRLANGFYAYALRPISSNTSIAQDARILAFRGTEPSTADFLSDVQDIGKAQSDGAVPIVNSWLATNLVDGNKIEFIGHSLGGALVQWAINNTNVTSGTPGSVLAIGRSIPDPLVPGSTSNPNFTIDPSQLHFYTFNAPGISLAPEAQATDKTTVVDGEHHVIALKLSFPTPILKGDSIHLLGGAPVGGGVIAHRVRFENFGDSGWFAHSIKKAGWWEEPADPSYVPPFPVDFQAAQAVGRFITNLFDANGRTDSEVGAAIKLAVFFGAASVIGLPFQLGNKLGELIRGVPVDLQTLANNLLNAGQEGLKLGLAYIVKQADSAGKNIAAFGVQFTSAIYQSLSSASQGTSDFLTEAASALGDFLKGTAKSIGNAFTDFISKASDAAFDFGKTIGSFTQFDPYPKAFAAALRDPAIDASLREAIEEARSIVESAGQTVVLEAERPAANPFDAPGFAPESAPLPAEQVREGWVKRFTLSLPYGAGKDGQRVAVALAGAAASRVKLLANGEEVAPQNGAYTVAVERGERELELGVWGQIDEEEDGELTLSATLVDGTGSPTHEAHLEAAVQFVARDDVISLFEGPPDVLGDNADFFVLATPLARRHLDAAGGNDQIWGDTGEDHLIGGAGDDRLHGSFRLYDGSNDPEDRDWLSGGAGNDQLFGHEGDDLLEGGPGGDIVLGDVGDDQLYAGSKDDHATIFTLGGEEGGGAVDVVQGGAGEDLVVGSGGADRLSGGNHADLIFGGGGGDVINGDTEFFKTHGFPIIGTDLPPEQPFEPGADVLYGNAGADTIDGEGGDDLLYGGEGADTLIGSEGNDTLYGGTGDDLLMGDSESIDPLFHGDDYLDGGAGADFLRGMGGGDTLLGNGGDDLLEGGDAADVYVFNRGDGLDTILDDGSNTLRFGPGIESQDLKLGLGSLFISIGDTGDAIRIENFNPNDVFGAFAIDNFEFFDGARLSYAQLLERGFDLRGTAEDDFIDGTNITDRISGGGGNDTLNGKAGDDVMTGGTGDDVYMVDTTGDVVNEAPDEGIDTVLSISESYTLGPNLENLALVCEEFSGSSGGSEDEGGGEGEEPSPAEPERVCGISGTGNELDNQIFGNEHDNVLDGGAGNDLLFGESGNDTYLFGRGSGSDTVFEIDDTPGNTDTIQFASDIAPLDIQALQEGNNLVLAIRNTTDRFQIQDWFVSDATKIESAIFADGTVWDAATLEGMATTGGGNTAPTPANAIADQSAPEDAAFSFTLPAGTFVDADLGDTLAFTAVLADGSPLPGWLSFNGATQSFDGTPTNDDVGAVDITVTATDTGGLNTADTFTLTVANVNDAPVLATPIPDQSALEDAAFSFTLPQNTFADVDAGDTLAYAAALAGGGALPAWLAFDGVTQTFTGTPANEDVGALSVQVTATDTAGESVTDVFDITVINVNDAPVLAAPLPDQSGNQNAPFAFVVPEGAFADVDAGDTLMLNAALADGSVLPTWLNFDPATRSFSGTPSEFEVGDLGIRVTATDNAGAAASGTFTLSVSDASTVDETHPGTRHRDAIVTGFANDLIEAGRGNDLVRSGAGRDTLFGGEGNDRLEGGLGNDTYVHEQHGGHDVIEETGGQDTLRLGAGIAADGVKLERKHDNLVVDLKGRDGSVTVEGWFASDAQKVETIQFADGTAWGIEEINARVRQKKPERGPDDANDHEHGQDQHGDRDDRPHGQPDGGKHDERDRDERPDRQPDLAGLLEAYLARKPDYDFEALAREFDRSNRHGEALSAHEIARRWQAVGRYVSGLSNERDDDARHGAGEWRGFDALSLLGGGASGGAFGHAGSTGGAHGMANLKTLQGLEEGFHRLHA